MILQIKNLTRAFGSVVVAKQIDLAIAANEALGIIGPNGAGKTSLFNLIAGALEPDEGSIVLDGHDITRATPQRRARLGIARSFQIPRPFGDLTVFENLLVAATNSRRRSEIDSIENCAAILERTGLMARANRLASSLTLLERKRLELARALATAPRVLLLDEIAGGLTEKECHALLATIQAVRRQGTTIIWIEHVVHALLAVVDRLVVLNFGSKIADGDPQAVIGSDTVREIYLGIEA